MAIAIADFWRLAVKSGVLSPAQCAKLDERFAAVKGAAEGNCQALVQWLVANKVLTQFQGKVLLAGKSGPFVYGDYRVYDRLTTGRFTGLFRGVHTATGHNVMLQFLSSSIAQDPNAWARIVAQVEAARAAIDPFLARVFHVVESGAFRFIVLEDIAGESLEDLLGRKGAVTPVLGCRYGWHAAHALGRLHALGQVHGAISPANLILTPSGHVKLLQVPLAREAHLPLGPINFGAPDPAGKILRAADYAAPELARPGRGPDALTDIYALGCTLHHILAGQVPFPGGDARAKIGRHAGQSMTSLDQFGVPPAVAQLVGYMVAKDPSARYQGGGAAAEALTFFVDPTQQDTPPVANRATLARYEEWLAKQTTATAMRPVGPTSGNGAAAPAATPVAAGAVARPAMAAAQAAASPIAAPPMAAPVQTAPVLNAPPRVAAPAIAAQIAAAQIPSAGIAAPPVAMAPPISAPPIAYAPPVAYGQPAMAAPPMAVVMPAPQAPAAVDLSFLDSGPLPVGGYSGPAAFSPDAYGGGATAVLDRPTTAGALPRTQAKKASSTASNGMFIGVGAFGLVLAVGLGFWMLNRNKDGTTDPVIDPMQAGALALGTATDSALPAPVVPAKNGTSTKAATMPGAATPAAGTTGGKEPSIEVVADDGTTLWDSPTHGKPLSTKYMPSGAQVLISFRPADFLGHPESQNVLFALGPFAPAAQQDLEATIGVPLTAVENLMLGYQQADDGTLRTSLVVRFSNPADTDSLVQKWAATAAMQGEVAYFKGPSRSYYFPAAEGGRVLTIADEPGVVEVTSQPDAFMPLREMQSLIASSDDRRHFSIFLSPAFALAEGQLPLTGTAAYLRTQARNFLGEDGRAASLSIHLGNDFFTELRVIGSIEAEPATLGREYLAKLQQSPKSLDDHIFSYTQSNYTRRMLAKFSSYTRLLAEYSRWGVEDKQAIVRSYLPAPAASHLLMCAELAMADRPGGSAPAAPVTTVASTPMGAAPAGVAGALKKKISLSFARDTLEKSMEFLGSEIGVKIEIIGPDLQLDGITKNQSFGLDERDKPADEILRTIMLKANTDGKLVYIIKPKAPGGEEQIFITTRAAVAKRKDKLPPELEKK